MQGDPLAQLRDIHLPDTVSAWPPGPGWWVLALVLLLFGAALVIWAVRRYRENAWRRQAFDELRQAHDRWRQSGDTATYLQTLNDILKRAALQQTADGRVAGLSGAEWDRYLDDQWRKPPKRGFSALAFANRVYQRQPDEAGVETLHELVRRWIGELRGTPC